MEPWIFVAVTGYRFTYSIAQFIAAGFIVLLLLAEPVINPENVKPGTWFIGIDRAQREADRQYVCVVREARTALKCEE